MSCVFVVKNFLMQFHSNKVVLLLTSKTKVISYNMFDGKVLLCNVYEYCRRVWIVNLLPFILPLNH